VKLIKQGVALTGRNRTGPPCSVGRPTTHSFIAELDGLSIIQTDRSDVAKQVYKAKATIDHYLRFRSKPKHRK